jgi:hypothetical protein
MISLIIVWKAIDLSLLILSTVDYSEVDTGFRKEEDIYFPLKSLKQWEKGTFLSEANASFIGEGVVTQLAGYAITGVGDVNNDNYDDILISAPSNEEGGDKAGQTYLILGKPTADWKVDTSLSDANASFIGENADNQSGWAVAGAGDVNKDGFDDIIIGAPNGNETSEGIGKTYLIFGRPTAGWNMDISLSDANASFIGENSYEGSGKAVTGVGDVNNDSFDDFLISAPYNWEGNGIGKIYLVLGRPTANWRMDISLTEANASFLGEGSSDYSGKAIADAGDVNNDGFDDFVIGAYANSEGGVGAGQTYLILGKPTADWRIDKYLSEANASYIGENSGDHSGFAVAGAGDVNNDGFDDFAIGALHNAEGGVGAGQTYLILGKPTVDLSMDKRLSEASASFIGEGIAHYSGCAVAGAGDTNNDGFDDIIIGAWGYLGQVGQTYLVMGQPTANWEMDISLSEASASFIGALAGGEASGKVVTGAGDVNNDGFDDILIGAPYLTLFNVDIGRTYLILGRFLDYLPPTLAVDSPLSSLYTSNTITISFVGDATKYWYYISGVDIANQTWISAVQRSFMDGTYILHAYGNDSTGNMAYCSVTFTIDTTNPTIDDPSDLTYEEGTTGHNLTWTPSDANPSSFLVSRDGILVIGGPWSGEQLIISIDGLSVGTYLLNCTIYDKGGNFVSETVIVPVTSFQDTTNPTIDHPSDLTYEEGTTGHNLTWTPSDANPSSFLVLRDGILVIGGPWSGEQLIISIDGLSAGIYLFNCTIYDKGGNFVSDTVIVIVTTTEKSTITTPTTEITTTTTTTTTTTSEPGSFSSITSILLSMAILVVIIRRCKKT